MLATLVTHLKSHAPFNTSLKNCAPGQDCDECPNQDMQADVLPLCLVKQGQAARIVRVDQEPRLRKRLADLGLAAGMDVRVLRASVNAGPMILAVRCDTRLAVGWAMARRIEVELA
ncbi:MAG TPA: FeoA family protein [Aggregatilineaceae bacterium]|nr:FeoA family protein [Aggregatilineaceae bacterium]